MVSKIQDWYISSLKRVYFLYKSVPCTEKRLQRPETGIKDGFEEMEHVHEFLFGPLRPKKTGLSFQMFRCSRGGFLFERPKKSSSIYLPTGFFPETFCKWQTSLVHTRPLNILVSFTRDFNLDRLASKFSYGGSSV